MPTITIIDGLKIECYSGDHLPPHIHATYGEHEVLIKIDDGEIYRGNLPTKKLKIATNYVLKNQNDLLIIFEKSNPQLSRDEK